MKKMKLKNFYFIEIYLFFLIIFLSSFSYSIFYLHNTLFFFSYSIFYLQMFFLKKGINNSIVIFYSKKPKTVKAIWRWLSLPKEQFKKSNKFLKKNKLFLLSQLKLRYVTIYFNSRVREKIQMWLIWLLGYFWNVGCGFSSEINFNIPLKENISIYIING